MINVVSIDFYYPDQIYIHENKCYKVVRCLHMVKPSKIFMVTIISPEEQGRIF